MKYLAIISALLFSFVTLSQEEKGSTVSDRFTFKYDDGSNYNYFSDIWPSSPYYGKLDTFKIANIQSKEIEIKWSYLNETGFHYPMYDSVQWYFNGVMLTPQDYTLEIFDGHSSYRAKSSIIDPQVGYYQLRKIGKGNMMTDTNYPTVHVFEKKKDSVIAKSSTGTRLYPNPTTGKINLKLNETIQDGEMQIYNLNGEFVRSIPLREVKNNTEFDVSFLKPGIYLFSIINNENSAIKQMKIVIE